MGGEKEHRKRATAYATEATISTSGMRSIFKSLLLRQIRTQNRIQEIVSILRFLLLFRGIFALFGVNFIVCDKKSLSFQGICAFGGWALLLSLKLWG